MGLLHNIYRVVQVGRCLFNLFCDDKFELFVLVLLLFLTFSVLVANPKNYFTRWPIPLVVC